LKSTWRTSSCQLLTTLVKNLLISSKRTALAITNCEHYDILSKPEIKAYSELENVPNANTVTGNKHDHLTKINHTNNISCKLSVADVQIVESDNYLTVVDDGGMTTIDCY
jgi:hypothetical protein